MIKFFYKVIFVIFVSSLAIFAKDYIKIANKSTKFQELCSRNFNIDLEISNLTTNQPITIDSIILVNPHYKIQYELTELPFVLTPASLKEQLIQVNFNQNLDYNLNFLVYYTINSWHQSFVESSIINIQFVYNDLYDNFTQNKVSLELKSALASYLSNHTAYTYKDARQYMFGSIDNVDGWVECVYTGRKIQTTTIPDVNTTHFNNEHTWPQSMGADYEPPKSDLYHMYPTDETANAKRGDYPFGFVKSNIMWSESGSMLGKDENGAIVFEPRDVHKGNVARSLFYFAIAYNNPFNYLNSQEKTLRQWMNIDTVDDRERKRNSDIAALQGKRNPFINHPEFIDRIYSISTNEDFPAIPQMFVQQQVNVSSFFLKENEPYKLYLSNNGNSTIIIDSISLENMGNEQLINNYQNIINYTLNTDTTIAINVSFADNAQNNQQKSNLIIYYNGNSQIKVNFKELYFNSITEKDNLQNILIYPNPSNNYTYLIIPSSISVNSIKQIVLYNSFGEAVKDNFSFSIENNSSIRLEYNLQSNYYFVELQINDQFITLPLIISK
jgi:endonuclease I